MRKSTFFFRVAFVTLVAVFTLSLPARAQASKQDGIDVSKLKGVVTYTLVITGMHNESDAKLLNDDLLKIDGVLLSTTEYASGKIVTVAKKGVMPEQLKKVIVAHNGDISAFSEKFQ